MFYQQLVQEAVGNPFYFCGDADACNSCTILEGCSYA